MSKKKKRIRRKIKEVAKGVTIRPSIHSSDSSELNFGIIQPRGRNLVEQDLSNLLTSPSFNRSTLFVRNGEGNSFSFDPALPSRDRDDGSIILISDDLIKDTIETIIELDQRVDFLQGKINGKNAPSLKKCWQLTKENSIDLIRRKNQNKERNNATKI